MTDRKTTQKAGGPTLSFPRSFNALIFFSCDSEVAKKRKTAENSCNGNENSKVKEKEAANSKKTQQNEEKENNKKANRKNKKRQHQRFSFLAASYNDASDVKKLDDNNGRLTLCCFLSAIGTVVRFR